MKKGLLNFIERQCYCFTLKIDMIMPKQKGLFITGTYNGMCYYKMNGQYYVRRKSTLSGKRVKRSPAFKLTMKYAGLLGQASRMAGEVYRSLPRAQRKHALYRALTGLAMQLLKAGTAAELVVEQLRRHCAPVQQAVAASTVVVSAGATTTATGTVAGIATASTTSPVAAPVAARPVWKPKASPSPNLQTKYARIFVHASGRISARGLGDAIANKCRRRLLASVEERE
jgi:hypothetical protein